MIDLVLRGWGYGLTLVSIKFENLVDSMQVKCYVISTYGEPFITCFNMLNNVRLYV